MSDVCVITGGGSGMGLEVAKLLGKNQKIILMGRTVSKLDKALDELRALGIDAEPFPGDVSDRESVKKLAAYAASKGTVKTVIHAAGVSPHMTSAENIFKINAIGTMVIDEELAAVMGEGSCILNVSSMSAYMLPPERVPKQLYELSSSSVDAFQNAMSQAIASAPEQQQTGMAYTISKNFVIWYTARKAVELGKRGIRLNSISPGTFKTPLGEIEGEGAAYYALNGALGRLGEPEEIAKAMEFMVSDACSYLCGVDLLYDGGAIAAFNVKMANASN